MSWVKALIKKAGGLPEEPKRAKDECKRCGKKNEDLIKGVCKTCLYPLEIQTLQDLKVKEHRAKWKGKENKE